MPSPRGQKGIHWDTCLQCGKELTLTTAGQLRQHGHPARRCTGSGSYGQEHGEALARIAAQ